MQGPKMKAFQMHLTLIAYYRAQRVPRALLSDIARKANQLPTVLYDLYGTAMTKPKLHFSTHVNLTFERYMHDHVIGCSISLFTGLV